MAENDDNKREPFPKRPQGVNKSQPVLIKNRKALPVEVRESEEQAREREAQKKSQKSTPVLIRNRKPLPVIIAKEDREKVTFEDFEWIARNAQKSVVDILDGIKNVVNEQLDIFKTWFEHSKETDARAGANDSLGNDNKPKKGGGSSDDDGQDNKRQPFFKRFDDLGLTDWFTVLSAAYLAIDFGIGKIATSIPLIQGIGLGIAKVAKDISGLTIFQKVGDFFTSIGDKFKNVQKYIKPITASISYLGGLFGTFIKPLGGLIGMFGKYIPFVNIAIGVYEFLKGFIEGFAEGGVLEGIKQGLGNLFESFIAAPINFLSDVVGFVAEQLGFEKVAEALYSFDLTSLVTNFWGNVKSAANATFDSIVSFFSTESGKFILDMASWLFPAIKLIEYREEIITKALSIKDSVVSFISDSIQWLKDNLSFTKIVEKIQAWLNEWINGEEPTVPFDPNVGVDGRPISAEERLRNQQIIDSVREQSLLPINPRNPAARKSRVTPDSSSVSSFIRALEATSPNSRGSLGVNAPTLFSQTVNVGGSSTQVNSTRVVGGTNSGVFGPSNQ